MAFLDWFTGIDSEDEQARSDKLDADLRALNESKRDQYGEDWFAQAQQHINDNAIPDVAGSIDDSFWEGWNEGAANIRSATGTGINKTAGTLFRILPWQVWLGLALYLAFLLSPARRWLKKGI